MMNIVIIGTGYVGLVSGACFAEIGHNVICVDKNEAIISALLQGEIPIFEPGLDVLVKKNVDAGRLSFSVNASSSIAKADVVFLCVGTPSRKSDGHADLTYVYSAAKELAENIKENVIIVTKSTVPVGTGDEIEQIISEINPDAKFSIISNPEFLREGSAIEDFMKPDRIVIGSNENKGREMMQKVYAYFLDKNVPILHTSRRSSELIKYTANAFLSVKLSFINEIADLCEAVGADVNDVADGIGHDKRIGRSFLNAGPGYGGSCFPKDTLALVRTAHDFNSPVRTVETIVATNDFRKRAMAQKIEAACEGSVRGKTIAILGLTFKPNTDDMREAPSISIIEALQDFGANIKAYDPHGMIEAKKLMKNVEFTNNAYEAANDANAIAIITEWAEFLELDFKRIAKTMSQPIMIDLRNMFDDNMMSSYGFAYSSVGKKNKANK